MSAFPFLGDIEIYAFDFPPAGWAKCEGQLLPIQQNKDLFSLLGTTYGGDGLHTFALPNLCGQTPIGNGSGSGLTPRQCGDTMGSETVTLDPSHVPSHKHALQGAYVDSNTNTFTPDPTVVLAKAVANDSQRKALAIEIYAQDPTPAVKMNPSSIGVTGGQPHPNMMPFVTLNVCICLTGPLPGPG
jgi:microcystin-dependent protein